MDERTIRLVNEVVSLSAEELREFQQELVRRLGGEGGELTGVREPRRPPPESPGDEIALGPPGNQSNCPHL